VICAKKVSASDITYIPDLDAECERIFRETYKEISLNGDITGKTREKQSEIIEKLEARVKDLEMFNRMLQQSYGDDIVQKALKALEQGKMTKAQFKAVIERFEKRA